MGLIIVCSIYAIIFGAVSYKMYQEYQWEKSWYGIPSFESKFFYISSLIMIFVSICGIIAGIKDIM